jgi:hypothetical protein
LVTGATCCECLHNDIVATCDESTITDSLLGAALVANLPLLFDVKQFLLLVCAYSWFSTAQLRNIVYNKAQACQKRASLVYTVVQHQRQLLAVASPV